MRERDFRFHGYYYRTSLAPSFTPKLAMSLLLDKDWGGGARPSPSLGEKSVYLESALVVGSFLCLQLPKKPRRTFRFLHASDTSLAQGCGAGPEWRWELFGGASCLARGLAAMLPYWGWEKFPGWLMCSSTWCSEKLPAVFQPFLSLEPCLC